MKNPREAAGIGAPRRPSREEIAAADGRTVPDVVAPGLDVLFCGINPGLYSGATGHHFARPGNRFWRTLQGSGFTPRAVEPWEDGELIRAGIGITNLVERATAAASELTDDELRAGARRLKATAERLRPRAIAVLGITAYRVAFGRPAASVGRQPHDLGPSELWVLPNPSGLNAGYQMPELVRAFGALHAALRGGLGAPPR